MAFFDMGRLSTSFLVGPTFLGVLSLKSAAQHVFGAGVAAAGKAFLYERLKIGRDV
jgi:hypothetical protein